MPSQSIVFYDGGCGLCHRAVRFALAHDHDGSRFRFAPLDGDAFRTAIPASVRPTLPDSIVLLDPDGSLHVRSDAVLSMCQRLGGGWGVLATIAGVIPRRLLDAAYDAVARVRLRLFRPPEAACPILPAHLRDRFL